MKTYLIRVTEPMQIPAIIYEARVRASEEPLYVMLDHQEEPNIVRGRSQPFENQPGIKEIRRPDGGLSWYHPVTFCLIRGKLTDEPRRIEKVQREWGSDISNLLSMHGYRRAGLFYENSDIFALNGEKKHLVGMSGWIGKENGNMVKIQRACWYEENPIDYVRDLLVSDGIVPSAFESSLELVKNGFFSRIAEMLKAEEVGAMDFVSGRSWRRGQELQGYKAGNCRGSCVMGRIR